MSAADLQWPDMIRSIARQYGVHYQSDEEIAKLSFDKRSNWVRRNPVPAARHFQYRANTFFNDVLKSPVNLLGEITDDAMRVEFQGRGSPHIHCVLWVKDAPKYDDVDSNSRVCEFIDKHISASLPGNDGKNVAEA